MSANTLNENERFVFNGWPMIGEGREIREDSTKRLDAKKPGMNTFKNVTRDVYRHRGKFVEFGEKRRTPDISL